MLRRRAALAGFLWLSAAPSDAAGTAAAPVRLAAHRAVYRMALADGRSSAVGLAGTMGYEVIDACSGWAVRQRLDMTITNTDGQNIEMVSDYVTWESKDGSKLRFHLKQTTDGAVTSQTDGEAQMPANGKAGIARYTLPRSLTRTLPPGTLFPMAHTARLITAAEAGRKFLTLPLFDGTDDSGAELSSIVILDRKPPQPDKWPALALLPSTRVHIAFFDLNTDDMLPDYEVEMRYWTNGVADDLHMDFGDFVARAKMVHFALLPRKC